MTLLQVAKRALDKTPHAARNTIPPITDPMGKHWEQPDPSRFVITDERVVMSRSDFDKLHDYSHSQPTGTYPGKCWKRGGYEKGNPVPVVWWLCWFGAQFEDNGEKFVSNHYREIVITD
jgi:hypothetical protein